MKNIIEKLGITPGPWVYKTDSFYSEIIGSDNNCIAGGERNEGYLYDNADTKIMVAAPEMLMWIIGMMKCADNNNMVKAAQLLELGSELIEKVTYPKTWDEVKEL